jgi:hypothetical protein
MIGDALLPFPRMMASQLRAGGQKKSVDKVFPRQYDENINSTQLSGEQR